MDLSDWFRALLSNYDDADKRVRLNIMYSGWTPVDSISTSSKNADARYNVLQN